MEPFFSLSDPLLLGSVLKKVATAKLELESAEARIQAAGSRNATNFEIFDNDLMVDVTNLLLLGQLWRVTKTIQRNQRRSQMRNIASRIDGKILAIAKKINRRGGFVPVPLQKLVEMQLGSILIIADILANE
jgi:hypothetical protein